MGAKSRALGPIGSVRALRTLLRIQDWGTGSSSTGRGIGNATRLMPRPSSASQCSGSIAPPNQNKNEFSEMFSEHNKQHTEVLKYGGDEAAPSAWGSAVPFAAAGFSGIGGRSFTPSIARLCGGGAGISSVGEHLRTDEWPEASGRVGWCSNANCQNSPRLLARVRSCDHSSVDSVAGQGGSHVRRCVAFQALDTHKRITGGTTARIPAPVERGMLAIHGVEVSFQIDERLFPKDGADRACLGASGR